MSDPLKVPKTVQAMKEAGIAEESIENIVWKNPLTFFGQSGRLEPAVSEHHIAIDQRQLWEGNSVLRGQDPVIP